MDVGASNALGHVVGAILISLENQFTPFTTRLCFDCTNNIAKYEACVMGIKATIESKLKFLERNYDMVLLKCVDIAKAVKIIQKIHEGIEGEHGGKQWFHDIKSYVRKKKYPMGILENEKKIIRRLSMNFFLNGDVLYKRNHDMVLLRCVDKSKVKEIIQEVYEGSFGTHANGLTTIG
ncbi:uncharacterized protein [Cicer arietinum]|uniref:uncharacterized protein n=1 Tax=Cicer arietinum TaxID=3827 RepID=UPI003CC51731